MQITGEIDWNEEQQSATAASAGGALDLDQREEFKAVRSLTAKLASDHGRSPEYHSARDMYLDLDEALPLHWESLTGKGQHRHKLSKSTDSSEFEFSMSGPSAADPLDPSVEPSVDGISPADDLFYKGQLLPLHLPKRLQMVQKLSSPKRLDNKDVDSVTVSCFFQPGSLKYSAPGGGDDANLESALVNSRSSSFHSEQGSNNFWDSDSSPNELDSADSSSSRDSSGSSNDSVNVPGKQSLPKFNDHIAFQKEGALFQQRDYLECHNHNTLRHSEKPQFPSWFRTPFKWKLFSGLKKPPRPSMGEFGTTLESSGNGVKASKNRSSGGRTNMKSARGTYYSAEMNLVSNKKEVPFPYVDEYHRGGILFPGEGSSRVDGEGNVSSSKSRESLHKYFNMLKISSVKGAAGTPATSSTGIGMGPSKAFQSCAGPDLLDVSARSSFSGNLTPASSPQQQPSSFKVPISKGSLQNSSCPYQEKGRSRSPSPFSLSGNLRVPSFSRSSKASASAGNATKSASPHHSGLLNHSPSTMAELHNAIQGAIAHCKQSQAVSR
ncbi:unnamed protein product [Calypogeia fissa]